MTTWALLAPGPSASAAIAERLRGFKLGAVGCAFQLAPWADFIASSDASWWRKYPEAKALLGRKFCMSDVEGVTKVHGTAVNSGALALECAKREGATRILLCGFDMHGSHFFGQYQNGLRNTQPHQRAQHFKQFDEWARVNKGITVLNCTPGSALRTFPAARLEDETSIPEPPADGAGAGRGICEGSAA